MPSNLQWPELLEEQAYLVQMLSEVAHDSGALEHTYALLDVLRADLRACTMQVAELERENRESSSKHHDSKIASSASKLYHRVTANITPEKDRPRHGLGEDDKQARLLAVWTRKRTLGTEVKNLQVKAQFLRRQNRLHDELQQRLVTLYARIPEGKGPSCREEDEAEEDARRAQLSLHEIQRTLDRHTTLTALLRHGDYALINAGRHLSAVGPSSSSGVDAAKRCAVQTSVVVDQARHLDPSFFEQEQEAEVLKAGWLRDVFKATSADNSHPPLLLQALKPHHTALLSLISRAHKRVSEHNTAAHRAARQCSEARARRDALKRQVLVKWASAEAESDAEMFLADHELDKDGLARMREITAGLEGAIPIAATQRSSATASPSGPSEERQRGGKDEPVRRPSPLAIPQPHAPQPSRPLLPSKLMLELATTPTSTPSSTPQSNFDPRRHTEHGSGDMKLRQPPPAARQAPSPDPPQHHSPSVDPAVLEPSATVPQPLFLDPAQNQVSSSDPTMRQPQSNPQQNRQPGSGSDPQDADGLSHRSQLQGPSRASRHGDTIPQSQPQPSPGNPIPQDVPPCLPPLKPIQPIHQNAKSLQHSTSNIPNLSTNTRPQPPVSNQNTRPRTAESRQTPPPSIPQPAHPQLPEVNITPSHRSYPDSRKPGPSKMPPPSGAQDKPEPQTASGSSRSASNPPQATLSTSSAAVLPSQRPVVHGILKQPPISVAPRPSAAADADPWGVKVAAASSRPQPKLKTMFSLWRSSEGLKNADSDNSRARVATPPELKPPTPKKQNPRAAIQRLRFVDAVQIISRPAVDSDPYEDEDKEEEEELPPSPQRGSMIWLHGEEDGLEESEEDYRGDVSDMEGRSDAAEVPINTTFTANPSQLSISSISSSHSTDHSTYTISTSSTTPPSSTISPFSASSSHRPSYHSSPDDGWIPSQHQLDTLRGEGDDKGGILARVGDHIRQDTFAPSSWSGFVFNPAHTASQEPRNAQPAVGRTGTKEMVSYDDLHLTDTRSRDPDHWGRLMPPSGSNLVPINGPTASSHTQNSPHQIPYGSLKSDRELLQTIFPSPSKSTISERDLLIAP